MGRPPKSGVAMTVAERQRISRAKHTNVDKSPSSPVSPRRSPRAAREQTQAIFEEYVRIAAAVPEEIDLGIIKQWCREAGSHQGLETPSDGQCKAVARSIRLALAEFPGGPSRLGLGKARKHATGLLDHLVEQRAYVQRQYQLRHALGVSDIEPPIRLKRIDKLQKLLCHELKVDQARKSSGSDRAKLIERIAQCASLWLPPRESKDKGPPAVSGPRDPICIFVAKVVTHLGPKEMSPDAVYAVLQRQRNRSIWGVMNGKYRAK